MTNELHRHFSAGVVHVDQTYLSKIDFTNR
ncbi:Protein of unknown function [Lactobacillus helveticus CIRM-BIA 101]|nr:Protein of unknown function [Lactobacillus helveticus CIRM-BIA 101]